MKLSFATLIIAVLLTACNTNTQYQASLQQASLYTRTVHQLNTVVVGDNFPPMIAARNNVYAAIAAYEVIATDSLSGYTSLQGKLTGLTKLYTPATNSNNNVNLAAQLAYIKVGEALTFPEGSMVNYRDSMLYNLKQQGLTAKVLKASQLLADTVANQILAWAKKDNYLQTRSAERYNVKYQDGRWVPTPPMYAQGVEPYWCTIRPMVMDSAAQFKPLPPPPYNMADKQSIFYREVRAVKNTVDSLTAEQQHIANFWDDNPFKLNVIGHVMFATKKFSPPGHWMNITGIANLNNKATIAKAIYANAIVAIALYDAFISCWDEKYRSNYVRPETVINKTIGNNWQPYIQTPPFPEYTSGHAVISAAAAEVLTAIYGVSNKYTDDSEQPYGIASRSYSSYKQAAAEAAISRYYGGIHYRNSCITGTSMGEKLGVFIVSKLQVK